MASAPQRDADLDAPGHDALAPATSRSPAIVREPDAAPPSADERERLRAAIERLGGRLDTTRRSLDRLAERVAGDGATPVEADAADGAGAPADLPASPADRPEPPAVLAAHLRSRPGDPGAAA